MVFIDDILVWIPTQIVLLYYHYALEIPTEPIAFAAFGSRKHSDDVTAGAMETGLGFYARSLLPEILH